MVGWHHQFNGHEFEQTLGDGDGQGSLACCGSWCQKESDTTEVTAAGTILDVRDSALINKNLELR